MTEKLAVFKEKAEALRQRDGLSAEADELLEEMLAELEELERSNKALKRAALKAGQRETMSTRLKEALYE
ncbi:Ni2+-binding GTPase [Paenibacillus tepidiphilus]|uniref:Ni2+-binding GTPase n=1 Tax=Paenibacillus tepidiphilus TaxID=2608683 RepID=UPI00123C1CBC|nr:Ni2+-binding GTPase [Paenibacillus tepidiphilus]